MLKLVEVVNAQISQGNWRADRGPLDLALSTSKLLLVHPEEFFANFVDFFGKPRGSTDCCQGEVGECRAKMGSAREPAGPHGS